MPPRVLAVCAKTLRGAINDFGKDFVTHWFSSVVNTPSMTPELSLIVESPLLHVIRFSTHTTPKYIVSLLLRQVS